VNPLRLLLGSGRLPAQIRAELAHDDVVLLEEGLVGSVTRRHYRATIGQTFPLERASDAHPGDRSTHDPRQDPAGRPMSRRLKVAVMLQPGADGTAAGTRE
jgi:hypothetical protein